MRLTNERRMLVKNFLGDQPPYDPQELRAHGPYPNYVLRTRNGDSQWLLVETSTEFFCNGLEEQVMRLLHAGEYTEVEEEEIPPEARRFNVQM